MNRPTTILKFPPNLVLTSVLSGGLTVGLSLIFILLSLTFFLFRSACDLGGADASESNGAKYFWNTIVRVYILSSTCQNQRLTIDKLTDESTFMILVSVTMAISVVCLIAAITLITIVQDEGKSQYVSWVVFTYIGCCVVSLVVDLTTASHFGVDYSYLSSLMRQLSAGSPTNYRIEVIRQGAFWLMTIALKGYIAHMINGVFLILLAVYVLEYQKTSKNDEHSIHKLGALNAFSQIRKPDDNNSHAEFNNNILRGPNSNLAFVEDMSPQRSPRRLDPPRSDYFPAPGFDRSHSWHHSQNNLAQNSRPFSYLEEIKRAAPQKPQHSPMESPWRREPWVQPQAPLVPAPDYSPNQPRRLKSALKPVYL